MLTSSRAPFPHTAISENRQFTSSVAPRKTNAAVSAAPRKKAMTGRGLFMSPLTFQSMFSDLEGGEGETQDDGSSENIGMVYMATGSRHLLLPSYTVFLHSLWEK